MSFCFIFCVKISVYIWICDKRAKERQISQSCLFIVSLRTQRYFWLLLVSAANNVIVSGGDKRQPEIRVRSKASFLCSLCLRSSLLSQPTRVYCPEMEQR